MSTIAFSSDANAYRITLDAPPLHILDVEMLRELRDALAQVSNDRHALILDATGHRAFCAGTSVPDHLGDRLEPMLSTFHDCLRTIAGFDLVTVAFVRGLALGGGCELASACDFILASDRAQFGQPEIRLGVFPPAASIQLAQQLAPRKALELLLTGEPVDAAKAEQLGLVNAVFPHDEFDAKAEEWMRRLYALSASSLRIAKKAFRIGALQQTERLYYEELMRTHDATEGLNAFVEKRKPEWKDG